MTPHCQDRIKADEGLRLRAYPDPESPLAQEMQKPLAARCAGWKNLSGAPWTIGYGCTGPGIGPDTVWTQQFADAEFDRRFTSLISDLDSEIPWWRHLDDVRQDVIANMAWNLGVNGLLGFKRFLADLQAAMYAAAANEMMDSRWATQVPSRARRLRVMMLTGVSQTLH